MHYSLRIERNLIYGCHESWNEQTHLFLADKCVLRGRGVSRPNLTFVPGASVGGYWEVQSGLHWSDSFTFPFNVGDSTRAGEGYRLVAEIAKGNKPL